MTHTTQTTKITAFVLLSPYSIVFDSKNWIKETMLWQGNGETIALTPKETSSKKIEASGIVTMTNEKDELGLYYILRGHEDTEKITLSEKIVGFVKVSDTKKTTTYNPKKPNLKNATHVRSLIEKDQILGKFDYEINEKGEKYDNYERALLFLYETNTQLKVNFLGMEKPHRSQEYVDTYSVKLENGKHRFKFKFYNSINASKKSQRPTAYDILATVDFYEFRDFDDFCDSFGYEPTKKTERVYKAVIKMNQNIKKAFTKEEITRLNEIY